MIESSDHGGGVAEISLNWGYRTFISDFNIKKSCLVSVSILSSLEKVLVSVVEVLSTPHQSSCLKFHTKMTGTTEIKKKNLQLEPNALWLILTGLVHIQYSGTYPSAWSADPSLSCWPSSSALALLHTPMPSGYLGDVAGSTPRASSCLPSLQREEETANH